MPEMIIETVIKTGESDLMGHRKIWIPVAAVGISIFLFGCSAAFVPVDNGSEPPTDSGKTETSETETVDSEKESLYHSLS